MYSFLWLAGRWCLLPLMCAQSSSVFISINFLLLGCLLVSHGPFFFPPRTLQDILNNMLKMTAKWIREVFCLPCWEVICKLFSHWPSHRPLCPPVKLGRRKWLTARPTANKVWAVCGKIGYIQFKSVLERLWVRFKQILRNQVLLGEMTVIYASRL